MHHPIAVLPGAYRALPGDFDADGDFDVVAVALLPDDWTRKFSVDTFDGAIWLERNSDGSFLRHRLPSDSCDAATCEVMDYDSDGDLDIISFPFSTELESSNVVKVFMNQRLK